MVDPQQTAIIESQIVTVSWFGIQLTAEKNNQDLSCNVTFNVTCSDKGRLLLITAPSYNRIGKSS